MATEADRARIRLLLVDGLNLIRRVYAAQPGDDGPEKADDGEIASAQSLRRALRQVEPTHAVVVLEGPEPTWRHRLFPGYKAGHAPMPEALRSALPDYRDAFARLGVPSFELPGSEADDVIATLAVKCADAGGHSIVLSTDKIFLQLLRPAIAVRDHFAARDLDETWVNERFGVAAEALVDFLALTGDSTNGIAGVPGIGPKIAGRLLARWSSLDEVLAAARAGAEAGSPPEGMTPGLVDKLMRHAEDARLARSLVSLRCDLSLGLNLKALRRLPREDEAPGSSAGQ